MILKNIAYLGCPYTDPNPSIRTFREKASTQMIYDLRKKGILAYSPLTHNIPVDRLGVFGDFETWLEFDHNMLSRCNQLLILKLPGWEKSKGLAAEIKFAESNNIPIGEIIPEPEFMERVALSDHSSNPISCLLEPINKMMDEREWAKFHSPKNLAMNLQVEASEVAEHFTWLTEQESWNLASAQKQKVSGELGDVFISLLQLSEKLGVDIVAATLQKMEEIKRKYPIDKAKGSAKKYTFYTEPVS